LGVGEEVNWFLNNPEEELLRLRLVLVGLLKLGDNSRVLIERKRNVMTELPNLRFMLK
jgi:hypothetical protein